MHPLGPGIKINHLVFHLAITVNVVVLHWNRRHPIILLILSSYELRGPTLLSSCFIWIMGLQPWFLQTARFIPWKLEGIPGNDSGGLIKHIP